MAARVTVEPRMLSVLPARTFKWIITAIAVTMSAFHLYIAFVGTPDAYTFRSTHLGFALVLAFLILPARGKGEIDRPSWLDLGLVALSLFAAGYPILNTDYLFSRMYYVDDPLLVDYVAGIAMVLLVMEGTRRATGWALTITAAAFLAYGLTLGNQSVAIMLDQLYLTTEGIFGIPISVSATYVFLFIMFGAFIERSGAGKLFMDFALALAGHTAGGPAKVAIITSGFFGTVSGSAVANVMTTGTYTIPLMKRIGYRPAFAGAVEAVASTGGQIMPPVMGAAAFVMAEFLGTSYLNVAAFALIPALLYFLAVFTAVHFEAKRIGLKGLPKPDLPRLKDVLRARGHLFLPLLVLVVVLFNGYTPSYAALCGIASVIPVTWLHPETRGVFTPKVILEALAGGARNAVMVALACATAGIVVGTITLTGLGITFTQFVLAVSSETLLLALVLTMVAGIILGMGMPTTPAYIVQTSLLVPALTKLGVMNEAAHLFALYFAVLSAITPPVALAVFAANGISRAGLWESGLAALKLGATGYVIPFYFVFAPALLMIGQPGHIAISVVTGIIGVVCLAAALHAYLMGPARWWERLLLIAAALVLIKPGLMTDAVGASLIGLVLVGQVFFPLRPAGAPAPAHEPGE